MRIVIDTNLLVSGIVFLGLPAQLVDAARTGQFELCTSEHLPAESHPLQPPNGIHPLRVHSQGVRQMEAVIDRQAADELAGHFAAISKLVPLRPIRAEADYEAAVASLNGLLDAGAADEAHPLADLAATLGELIGDYDAAHYRAKDVAANEMLRFLMQQHGLKQNDLAQELGSQGVVSEILNGKRELNIRQMRALAVRFSVPVAAFVA